MDPATALEWASTIGPSKTDNYLAHSVKCLEHEIFKRRLRPYLILTSGYARETGRVAYSRHHCIVLFPFGKSVDDMRSRLFLAHELGHIIQHIPSLDTFYDIDGCSSKEEELFAWEFAYHLLLAKSDYYHDVNEKVEPFIISVQELQNTISDLVDELNPEISSALNNSFMVKS